MEQEPEVLVLAETENYSILVTQDVDNDKLYHLELGNATFHFFPEEWEEFMELVRQVKK